MKFGIKRILPAFLSLILAVCAVMSPITAGAKAVTIPGDGLTYSFNESTGVFTVSGNGDMYDFRDSTLGNNKQTPWSGIKDKIKTVVIEEGVTGIGEYSFYNCKNLTTVKLASTVKSIRGSGQTGGLNSSSSGLSYGAFRDCTSLTTINFPEGLEQIGTAAFRGCTSLKKLVLPDSLTKLGAGAFVKCTGLTSVTLGKNITELSTECFYDCENLAQINWGESFTTVSNWAFYNTRLTDVDLPDHITSVGVRSFANCYFLNSVTVHNSECEFKEIVGYNDPFNNSGSSVSTTLILRGHTGSTTQTIAEKYGYTFESIDTCAHEHVVTRIAREAVCDQEGIEEQYCEDCKTVLSQTTIPAPGHQYKTTKVEDETKINGHIMTYQTCEICGAENIIATHVEAEDSTSTNKKYVWVLGYYTYDCNATCTRPGWEKYTCSVDGCGVTQRNYVEKAGHKVAKWTVVTPATCTETGTKTGHCSVCNKDVTEEIPATGHTYDEANPDKTVDNTATNGHVTKYYTCTVCKQQFPKVEHVAWVEGSYTPNVITQPKCVIDGLERDTCDICGETRNVTLPANGQHEWEQTGVVNPTCTTAGRTNYKCKNCGLTKSDNVVEALGHDYQKVQDKCVAATCTTAGSDYYKCARDGCSSTKTETVAALGHEVKRGTYNEISAPTCETDGKFTATCDRCGIEYEGTKQALGHDYQDVEQEIADKPGHVLATPTCTRCKQTQTATQKHKQWLEGYYTSTTVTEGTCTTGLVTLDTCTICGERRTNTRSGALGHQFRFVRLKEKNTATSAGTLADIPSAEDIKAPEYSAAYICRYCGTVEYKTAQELWLMWSIYYINTSSEVRTGSTNASYLDVTGDKIINAKDYAKIYNFYKSYLAYEKEKAEASQTENKA